LPLIVSSRRARLRALSSPALVERGPALLDRGQGGLALQLQGRPSRLHRFGRAAHRAVDRPRHLGGGFVHAGGGGGAAALDPGDMGRHALGGAAEHFVGVAAAGGEGAELGLERAGLAVGVEAGFLHRVGDGARLRLGAREIVEEDSDVDLGGVGRRVEGRRLLVERRGLLGEVVGHPAEPVRCLVAKRHQPLGLAAQPRVIVLDPAGDDLEHAFERPALHRHLLDRPGEALRLAPRGPAEHQPQQGEQGEGAGQGGGPGDAVARARAAAAPATATSRRRRPSRARAE
jgi:hypothetical protein